MATFKSSTETARGKGEHQGMNWIRQEKRLAIYLRDGLACAYCGSTVESGAQLSLDHITPHSLGGNNKETNLVTCCSKCNSLRGNREAEVFAASVAGYLNHGITGEVIMAHVNDCVSRKLDIKTAKELISRRGSCFAVLREKIGQK